MSLLRSKFRSKHSTNTTKSDTDTTDTQLSDDQAVALEDIAPDDTSGISRPPKALASTKDTIRRVSTPPLIPEQHKSRSSSSHGSLDLESDPVTKQRHPASLPGDFTSLTRTASRESAMETAPSSKKAETTTTSESSRSRGDASEPSARRKTRSHTRRQDRVDSRDLSAMPSEDSDAAYKVSSNDESSMDLPSAAEASQKMHDIPRSLSIRKKEASTSPSPRSTSNEVPQLPPRSPARNDGAEWPSPESPVQASRPVKALIPAKTSSARQDQDKDKPPKGATMKERLAFARARAPSPPLDEGAKKVAIRPPQFDISKGLHQWISDLPSTSRPDRYWEWPKRWTCCRCEATTIVEQKVCANLECSHYRCPSDCRMIRVARPLGQFVGFGGS